MIKFLDLHKINQRFADEFNYSFGAVVTSGQYILGENTTAFEAEYASYCGSNYCVGVANGLDALTLILKGYMHLGKLERGDKIIVPANTFVATILSILHAGLEPVFIEPNPQTYNLDIDNVKEKIDTEVRAVVMVHLYGQLAEVEILKRLCSEKGILLISDAAQAHGAECKIGKAGNLADASAFSFYPSKNLGALGDGGAVTTSDLNLVEAIQLLRNYGSKQKYVNEIVGFNSRLDEIQAAFLRVKLHHLDTDNEMRRQIARRYLNEIKNPKVHLPYYNGTENHVFYAFVIEVEDRDNFESYLKNHGIGYLIHYPIPPHKQQALKKYSKLNLPRTERIHDRVLSLPISPVMTRIEVDTVINVLNTY